MKTYKKIIEGKPHLACPDHGTAIINGVEVSNPTEQMLIAEGWEDITIPYHERDLTDAKNEKIRDIENYANSEEVKKITLNEKEVWFDSATRTSLNLRFSSEQEESQENTSIWYEGHEFRMSVEDALDVVKQAELYAASVYQKAESDKVAVRALNSISEVDNFDVRVDYPVAPVITKEEPTPPPVGPTSIGLDKKEITLGGGIVSDTITAQVLPAGVEFDLEWESSDEVVAIVDKMDDTTAKVTMNKADGTTIITAKCGSVVSSPCEVTVSNK